MKLLIIAASARALAQSAKRAGFEPIAVDAFADRDLRASVSHFRKVRWQERMVLQAAYRLQRQTGASLWLYGGGVENFPNLVARLSRKAVLLGNSAHRLRAIASFPRLAGTFRRLQIPFPQMASRGRFPRWLYKIESAGGMGVLRYAARKGGYWQRRLVGRVYTLAFLSGGRRLFWWALHALETRALGKHPALFQALYGPVPLPSALKRQARWIAQRLVRRLRLKGWNSLDLILHRGRLYLIDLNPRPGAAINLWEEWFPQGTVAAHIQAISGREVVPDEPSEMRGYGVVWSRKRLEVPEHWPDGAVDIPAQKTIPSRQPVCGIILRGECLAELKERFHRKRWTVLK